MLGGLDLWGTVLRRKWLLIVGALVGVGLGSLWYFQTPPKFESAAQIHVTSKGLARAFQSGEINNSYDAYMSGYYISYHVLPTHAVVIRSPMIIRKAVQTRNLSKLESLAGSSNPVSSVIAGLSVVKGTGSKNGDDANILTLTFRGDNSEDCQVILSAVIEAYQDYLGETYQNVSRSTVELISKAKDELQEQLLQKEARYHQFRREAPLMWQSEAGTNVFAMRLGGIETARGDVVVRRVNAGTRAQAIVEALKAGASRTSLALMTKRLARNIMEANALQQTSQDWQSELLPLHVQEKMLMQLYGPEHPRVKALQEEIQMRENFYRAKEQEREKSQPADDYLETYITSLQQEVREAELQEQALNELFEKQHNLAKKYELYELQDEQYKADIERTKELFRSVVSRLQEINLVKDHGGYEARVLADPAPGAQVEPVLSMSLSMGGMLGLVCAFGIAMLVDLADKSFRSADEIRQQLGLPVLAHIPVMHVEAEKGKDHKIDLSVVSHHEPKSREAEAYRRVRTSLYFSTSGQNHRVIQVTSPDPSDGKTTLATNLAVSIAQSGKRVLLVDADFRRPRVEKIFGVPRDGGMTQVITGEIEVADAIVPSDVENLDLLPCGPRPPNPAELLSSPRFTQTLETIREMYDFVIVDTPPVLAVSDPVAIAPCVDGVLVTIRLSKSGRPNASRTIEQLVSVGAKVIGVVVNGVGGGQRYGYRYGRHYSTGVLGGYYYYGRYYRYEDDYVSGRDYGLYYTSPEAANGQNGNGKHKNGDIGKNGAQSKQDESKKRE